MASGLQQQLVWKALRKYLSKRESNLLANFHGNIGPALYIKYQHPRGDSPLDSLPDERSKNKSPQDNIVPSNNPENANEQPPQVQREHSEKGVKTSHSHGTWLGRWLRKRPQPLEMENLGENEGPFAESSIRRGFIRKVYLILTVQLGLTVGIICLFIYWNVPKMWIRRNPWVFYALLPVFIILAITLFCCEDVRRKVPENFILLLIFTMIQGVALGSIAGFFDAIGVMWAIGGTALVTLGLSLFALQTKLDLTITSGMLLVMLFVFLIFGILWLILQTMASKALLLVLTILYSAVGTLFFAIYLVVDTQLMMGRTYYYRLDPDDYIFAVLTIYMDIIYMWLFILHFIGVVK